MRYSQGLLITIIMLLAVSAPLAHSLTIVIDDNRVAGETLFLAIYTADNPNSNWQQEPYRTLKFVLPEETTAEVELDLPAGDYAVRAFVDTNGNGELETGRHNRPQEPFAISSSTERRKPSVHFKHAAFRVDEDMNTLVLKLNYPKESRRGEPHEDQEE